MSNATLLTGSLPSAPPRPQAIPQREEPAHEQLTDSTIIEAHDLALRKEQNDEWYVGREDLGSFIALPEIWAQAVIFMSIPSPLTNAYPTFGAVKHFVRTRSRDDEEFHEELDRELRILLSQLVRHRIIRSIGGRILDEQQQTVDLLPSVKQRHVRWFFSPVMLAIQAAGVVAALIALFVSPVLRPSLMHYFWSESVGLSFASAFLSAWLLTAQHELFHVLAARAAGLQSSLAFTTRGPFLVLEAHVRNLLKASRRARMLTYVAGMLSDLLVVAVATLLLVLTTNGTVPWPDWAIGIIRQVILLRLLGVVWQFLFALKTDVTNVLLDLLGDTSLHQKAVSYLKEYWHFLRNPVPKGPAVHFHERQRPMATRRVRQYARATILAGIAALLFYCFVSLRITIELIQRAGDALSRGLHGDARALTDGLIVVGILMITLGVFFRARKPSLAPGH